VHLDNDQAALSTESDPEVIDDFQDDATAWLLERDLSDPVERLFTVADEGEIDVQLTEFETEIAGRPMFRDHGKGDDISAVLDEAIVATEVGDGSDIYAAADAVEQLEEVLDVPMPIDHSAHYKETAAEIEKVVSDGADIFGLSETDDIGEHFLVLVKPEPEVENLPALETDSPPELEAELECASEPEADSEPEPESVVEYVANNPAPVDDEAFDQYLLRGQQLDGVDADSETLLVEHTSGVTPVDPGVGVDIDYHEDFQMEDRSAASSVSAIAGVIAQVMEEITASVERRLADFSIDADQVTIEVMLGNDVESIIQCVTNGYAPIVEIRPDLPAALRQLGQTEVDAIYVRISHTELEGNWNTLFKEDFVAPGSNHETAPSQKEDESALQPFAALDLDEFEFDDTESAASDLNIADSFSGEIVPYSDTVSDDPLSAIDFSPVADDLSWCMPAGIKFSTSSGGQTEIFTEFLDVFLEEGATELEKLEDAIAKWEGGLFTDEAGIPAPVSHALHTLKGIAKGVGLQCYGTLIHNYETLLHSMPPALETERAGYFQIVNFWLDTATRGIEHIERTRSDVATELPISLTAPSPEASAYTAVEEIEAEPAESVALPTVDKETVTPAPKAARQKIGGTAQLTKVSQRGDAMPRVDRSAPALVAQQSIRMTAEALDNLLKLTNQAQQLGVRSSESTVRSKLAAAECLGRLSSVRAHITKIADRALSNVTAKGRYSGSELDALEMDQYTELQEAANILRESVEDLDDLVRLSSRQISTAEALMKQQASVISSLGASIQAARVVPVSRLIPALRRIVRTVGADLGKEVSLQVLNQVGTLDRDNHARCQIILEHMVRNALDHGIESSAERVEQGKPAAGSISIDVNKEGSDYIITLSDDGRGIDPALMRETAYQRGLDVDVDALSDDEALRLIFYKGFTTAETVSEISGRGVGMDIVLSELQQIGGEIEIESVVGQGTQFHIRIPPNVSVNGALLVSTGERSYAIPLDGLLAVDHVAVDSFFDAVEHQTKLSLFGVDCEPAYLATICHGENLPERNAWGSTVPVLIAGSEGRYMAIAVDDVKQALELVIRSLGVQFSAVPGVAGATTTADGQAVVALDLNALVGSVGSGEHSSLSLAQEVTEALLVLVVDDSRTQRMVSTSQFDTLGVETITAENGMVAIDLLNTTHRLPDVILLDVEMPVKDGIQTLREIRKSVRYKNIPVIMVTSRTGAKHRALADEAGCDAYMGKPFNFPLLVEKISQLTGHNLQIS